MARPCGVRAQVGERGDWRQVASGRWVNPTLGIIFKVKAGRWLWDTVTGRRLGPFTTLSGAIKEARLVKL